MQTGEIELSGNLNEISVTKCQLRNDNFTMELSGTVNRNRIDLKIAASSFELSSLNFEAGNNRLQGLVDFNGRLSGTPGHPVLAADLAGGRLSFGDLSYQTLTAKLKWDSGELKISQAEFKQGESTLELNGMISFLKPLACELDIQMVSCQLIKLRSFIKIPPQLPIGGTLSGAVKISGPIDNPSVKIGGYIEGTLDEVAFNSSFDLEYSHRKITIDRIALTQGNGVILARGSWESHRALNARIRFINFPLQSINCFLKPPLKTLAGTINSEVLLEWEPDRITGEYGIEITNLELNQNEFDNLRLTGNFSDNGFTIKNCTINGKNGTIHGDGFIPWPQDLIQKLNLPVVASPAFKQLDCTLTIKNLSGSLINNYFTELTVVNGMLGGNLKINGELVRPQIFGTLECDNLKANISGLPLPVENFQATVFINNNQLQLKKARGTYGTGKFSITGEIDLEKMMQLRLNLGLTGSRLYYKNQYFDGYGDLNLKLAGPVTNPAISGEVLIFDSKVGFIRVGARKKIKSAWLPQFNLQIKIGNNTRCRVIGLADLPVKGGVQFQGTLNEPSLEGEVDSNNGLLIFYNNAFRINRAGANFKFVQGDKPHLELEASLRRNQTEIFLNIDGIAPDNLNIKLTSQPFMSQANIFALLNWADPESNQPVTPEAAVTGNLSIVTDTIFEDLLYHLRQALNVNYLYLEPDLVNNDLLINVGSFLTPQLSYSFSRSIFLENNKSWSMSLDYHLDPDLALEYNYSMLNGVTWRLMYLIKL